MILFSYKNPIDKKRYHFSLRVDPYNVSWNYNINTQTYDTYGGQVVQVLSVNIDGLTIDGQIGKEGPFGIHKQLNTVIKNGVKVKVPVDDPRWGGKIAYGDWITNDQVEQYNYRHHPKYAGLYQMAEFFSDYFSVSTQGGTLDTNGKPEPGKYIQIPMRITYDAGPYPTHGSSHGQTETRVWHAFPNNFPQFSRSNQDFAPLWKIEFSVYQADPNIERSTKNDAIKALSRIRDGIGWEAENPWIDPAANPKDPAAIVTKQMVSEFKHFLPKITEGDLGDMIWKGISMPFMTTGNLPVNTHFNTFGEDNSGDHPLKHKHKKKKKH
jgi:hypothetical protein